jgi:hypothetical protein
MVGLRPISLVGAEVAYVDFGDPNGTVGTIPLGGAVPISADVKMKGAAAFGVLYLGLAIGAGAQFKFGSMAMRGEYERFSAAGSNPSLFSLGLTWTFL